MKKYLLNLGSFKKKAKRHLKILETELIELEDKYKAIKFSTIHEKSDVWFDIKMYEFAIEQLKSII